MFDMLDVVIGVVFLYLIMSLIASAVGELIEALLHYRARDLERGIRELVRDPKLVQEIYDHPLVNGLFKGQYDANHKGRLPSYIPSGTFVLALLDAVENPAQQQPPNPPPPNAPPANPPVSPGAMTHWFSEAWLAFFDKNKTGADNAARTKLKEGLDTLKKAAGVEPAAQRAAIEKWFDASMDRVSGGYKRRANRNLFLIGLVAALWMNVDSIKVANELMINKPVRDAIVNSATTYAKNGTATPKDAGTQLTNATTELKKLGLPLGWHHSFCELWNRATNDPAAAMIKLLGILMTACAVSLGAPFWFDMLNKFMVVRSTIKPDEKSGKEGSKDPKPSK